MQLIANVALVGLGYVGLPLAVALAGRFRVTGFDLNATRVAELKAGHDRTGEIDHAAAQLMSAAGVRSAFLGYKKFPGHICISLNEEVVHGIGSSRAIAYGDIVKMDVGIIRDGWIGDNATSVPVGIIDPEIERLLTVTEEILNGAVQLARPGHRE